MKRFIVSVLCVAVFFIGLGGLIERAGATFKSDDRALEIIKQARIAIGGEDAVKQVKSLTMTARATQTFNFDGAAKTEQGVVEINMQLPNQLAKTMRFGNGDEESGANSSEKIVNRKVVVIKKDGDAADFKMEKSDGANPKVVIVKKGDGDIDQEILKQGALPDGAHKIIVNRDAHAANDGGVRQNELFRTAFALLLSAPEGLDVSYTYAGDGAIDGTDCDIIAAQAAGDASAIKLFIGKSSHLPVMMSYQAPKPFMIKFKKEDAGVGTDKDVKFFVRKGENEPMQTAEFQVKFSDYRAVGGLMLPFKWTQTADGQADSTLDVSNYEINPANISDKFEKSQPRVIMLKKQQ